MNKEQKYYEELIIKYDKKVMKLESILIKLEDFLKEYHKYRDSFKWNEQDYIDTIDEIEKIILGDK